jgi:hypothetical protein
MLKTVINTAVILTIALGGGAWLTWYAIHGSDQFGKVTISGWTSYPQAGTPEADPYAKAQLARDGSLSLGAAEGVVFFANKASDGSLLSGDCSYSVSGNSPSARVWTMYAVGKDQIPVTIADKSWPTSLHSQSILYEPSGGFSISIAASARPDNWLAVPAKGNFLLAFTLYDSPVATNKGLVDTAFPIVTKVGCNG